MTQQYNGRFVLNISSIDVRQGEILALVGPSGAGKSTLLRLLNFLEQPTSGDIEFEGSMVNGHLPLATRRRVTTVFQTPCLLNRSVLSNVRYGLSLRGEKIATDEVEELLVRLGLGRVCWTASHQTVRWGGAAGGAGAGAGFTTRCAAAG